MHIAVIRPSHGHALRSVYLHTQFKLLILMKFFYLHGFPAICRFAFCDKHLAQLFKDLHNVIHSNCG
jgi:hypothetical protein